MVTNGITYGASQLTSDGVSYTKDGKLTTVKSALDELINTSLTEIDSLKEKVDGYEKTVHYLADQVKVGDYVAYDAGTWDSSKVKPTKQGEFGGYTINTSKNSSVEWCWKESYKTTLNGWRVLSKDEKTKNVTIIHAGQPECYYHGNSDVNGEESIRLLNERANQYKNTMYAEKAHAMNYLEALAITSSESANDNDLRKTGDYYWLATANGNELWDVHHDSFMGDDYNFSWGFRPVIVLKSNILTTGKVRDEFNQEAWQLVEMK